MYEYIRDCETSFVDLRCTEKINTIEIVNSHERLTTCVCLIDTLLAYVYMVKLQDFIFCKRLKKNCAFTRACAPVVRRILWSFVFEPRYEKTGLRGFRPSLTQTGLYSFRK